MAPYAPAAGVEKARRGDGPRLDEADAALAVHRALEAAEAVCAEEGDPETATLDVIASLLDSSMLITSAAEGGGEIRIGMLETIRAYEVERLLESVETQWIRRNHAEYYCVLCEEARPHLVGPDEPRWASRLQAERDNLRLALGWSVENDVELGLRIGRALFRFWEAHNVIVEGHRWLTTLLARSSPPSHTRGAVLHAAAAFESYLGDYDAARRHVREALDICGGKRRHRPCAEGRVMGDLVWIFFSAMVVNNFTLMLFLGLCPFIGVSQRVETAFRLGLADIFVLTMTSVCVWALNTFVLTHAPYLRVIAFIVVIASLVQIVEMVIKKLSPVLFRALGIYLPLITTNCAVLALAVFQTGRRYGFFEGLACALGRGRRLTLALVLPASMRIRPATSTTSRGISRNCTMWR